MEAGAPTIRPATPDDADAIDALSAVSIRGLFPAFYDQRQTESAAIHLSDVDRVMLADGTFFVIEADGALVACGGWSRRNRLSTGPFDESGRARPLDPATDPARIRSMFVHPAWTRRGLATQILAASEAAARAEGFRTLWLGATVPGRLVYERFGFDAVGTDSLVLPDGVTIELDVMRKAID
jgi:GNAT superfamily N-acetyltransferase